ncbi:MAG TPA: hypothetical protein VKS01_11485 [Bryobacteraceae bacterium]|nr:hypothetical protein [Bryobacteraceae bacterium]
MVVLVLLSLAIPAFAQGYVDPGAGAMIWQIAAAAFLGVVFLLRRVLTGWFSRRRPRSPE